MLNLLRGQQKPRTDFNTSVRALMLIWYFLRATRYYFLLTNHSIHAIKGTEQNLINELFENLETRIATGVSDFTIYSHSQSSICFVVLSSCFSFETVHFRTVLYVFAMFLSDCIVILLSVMCNLYLKIN